MRNRDLPVTKSLPSYMYTYIRTRTCTVLYCMYLYPLQYPTNLVVPTYLPTYSMYITRPGGVQDHVLYIF